MKVLKWIVEIINRMLDGIEQAFRWIMQKDVIAATVLFVFTWVFVAIFGHGVQSDLFVTLAVLLFCLVVAIRCAGAIYHHLQERKKRK